MYNRVLFFTFLSIFLTLGGLQLTKRTTVEKMEDTQLVYFIDPLLLPYVLDYEKELNERGINIPYNKTFSVLISRLPSRVAGIAIGMYNDNTVNVSINIALWNQYNQVEKRFLIYHELSHDIFNVEHDSCKLMITSMSGVNHKYEDFDALMDELVNVIKCNQE